MHKRFFILVITELFAISVVMGQSRGTQSDDSEMSIEESYLQEAIELMIIRETSRSGSREQKLIALEYIGNALERGSTNEELRTTLEYLSLEGSQNRTRLGGRLANDYPDVRRQAARYLANIESKESKDALIKICTSDHEPMVLQEAIRSIGIVGLNENDDAVNAVVWVANRNHNSTAPDDLVALASLDTLDRLCEKTSATEANAVQLIVKIAEGPYSRPVKERAKHVLVNLLKHAAKQQKQG